MYGKKSYFKKNGKTTERTNSISASDFVNLTCHFEWYHINTGNKKNAKDLSARKKK